MCGIAGFKLGKPLHGHDDDLAISRAMADAIVHRGPDGGGEWGDAQLGVALAHRRLSILDLTEAGRQPMHSASGRYVIAFNGEIYNHLELRSRLLDATWRGHSDTETLLATIEAFGVAKTLPMLTGMFAFALFDKAERRLFLARDRLGEKPLYYGWQRDTFLFGSELKALAAHPNWAPDVDRDALTSFMRFGYVPAPFSIWCGIRKLTPGCWLELRFDDPVGTLPEPVPYWRALDIAQEHGQSAMSDAQAVSGLDSVLRDAIRGQMLADVPLGAFLSGGVDSSTIVALMQAESSRPVKTFSIGFTESGYNEAIYAKAVAAHLGTDHTELYVTPDEARAVIPRLPTMYDEPFGDVSQIPTHLVSAMARRHVTVSLSGDGGDELFGGYNRYFLGSSIWNAMRRVPLPMRMAVARAMLCIAPSRWDALGQLLPRKFRQPMMGDRAHKLASILGARNSQDVYRWLASHERDPKSLVLGDSTRREPASWADCAIRDFRGTDFRERMMFSDLVSYLPDDILCKVDRAAMAAGLETRVPLLDHRVVEFAWRLPMSQKIRDGKGKWILRQVLYKYVPPELIERPKQGFGVPIDAWLRGPLRDWAEGLLEVRGIREDGFLDADVIRKKWAEHLSGRRNWQYWIWNVLMFQSWKQSWYRDNLPVRHQ